MKIYFDWLVYDIYGVGDVYVGIFVIGGNYVKVVVVCMNNYQCQCDGKGVMCLSYWIMYDLVYLIGVCVKVFKVVLNGELGEMFFIYFDLVVVMDFCVFCKGCKKECLSVVDMMLIKMEYLVQCNE